MLKTEENGCRVEIANVIGDEDDRLRNARKNFPALYVNFKPKLDVFQEVTWAAGFPFFFLRARTMCGIIIAMKIWKPEEIKALRSSLGLSQAKLGELLGVSEDYISMLERGIRNPGKPLCFLLDRIKAEKVKNGPKMAPSIPRRGKKI